MKRSLAVLAAVLLAGACKTAGPRTTAVPTGRDPLRDYVGDVRVLRARADQKSVTAAVGKPLAGECDMVVRVRSASFQKGNAVFALDTVGRPAVRGREPRCKTVQPAVQLVLAGANAASSDLSSRVDAVLQTPEAYLRAKGVTFDRPQADLPKDVASRDAAGVPAEAVLGRKVTAWPKLLLSVSPYAHDPSGRLRQESEVEFEAVVGTDGRVHQPQLKTALSSAHQDLVLGALSRWRYEPARTASAPVAARINSRMNLRIY
jgi:hypothetical protein